MTKKRDVKLDIINVLAILAVVALHHNGLTYHYDGSPAWVSSFAADCVFYWAVPVFFMLSGVNLIGYSERYSTKEYAVKRISRAVFPFIFWSVAMLGLKYAFGFLSLEGETFGSVVKMILEYKVESVYWFFGPLFAAYLVIPVLTRLRNDHRILLYITVVNFIFVSLIPILKAMFGFYWTLDVPIAGGLLIYVTAGYLLKVHNPPLKARILIYITGIAGLLFRFIYTYIRTKEAGELDSTIKSYGAFHAVFFSIAVFVFFMNIEWSDLIPEKFNPLITELSGCSFGIFLIHRFIMLCEQKYMEFDIHSIYWRTLMIFVTYFISLVIVYIIRKIPYLRRIMG